MRASEEDPGDIGCKENELYIWRNRKWSIECSIGTKEYKIPSVAENCVPLTEWCH